MKNVLFFVHGIGRHGKGWCDQPDGPIAALDEAMKRYDCFEGKKLSDFVDIVEIRYDDLFDLVLKQWIQLAQDLGPAAGQIDFVQEVQKLLVDAGGSTSLYADFGGDVLLYGGFDLIARAVRLRCASVFAGEVLKRHMLAQDLREKFPKFGIVAHSMGTAVTHDTLWTLATADFLKDKSTLTKAKVIADLPELLGTDTLADDQRENFGRVEKAAVDHPDRPMPFPVNTLMLVSNVIPLVSRAGGDYLISKQGQALQCAYFRDVNNKFDPICNVKRFDVGTRTNGKKIGVDHIHIQNVHGFGHYLSNPLIHMPLLTRMTDVVTQADIKKSRQIADEEFSGLGGGLEAEVKAKLEGLLGEGGLGELIAKARALKELIA